MLKPEQYIEIFLQPGDFYFGDAETRIRTILGSCVSIVMWHPKRLIGGMCHYVLPSRPRKSNAELDGHYADEAMQLFMKEIKASKTNPSEYRVRVFGGGNMFIRKKIENPDAPTKEKFFDTNVAERNVLAARSLITSNGFKIEAEDMGGNGHRQLIFDVWSGDVWLRKPPPVKV